MGAEKPDRYLAGVRRHCPTCAAIPPSGPSELELAGFLPAQPIKGHRIQAFLQESHSPTCFRRPRPAYSPDAESEAAGADFLASCSIRSIWRNATPAIRDLAGRVAAYELAAQACS